MASLLNCYWVSIMVCKPITKDHNGREKPECLLPSTEHGTRQTMLDLWIWGVWWKAMNLTVQSFWWAMDCQLRLAHSARPLPSTAPWQEPRCSKQLPNTQFFALTEALSNPDDTFYENLIFWMEKLSHRNSQEAGIRWVIYFSIWIRKGTWGTVSNLTVSGTDYSFCFPRVLAQLAEIWLKKTFSLVQLLKNHLIYWLHNQQVNTHSKT